MEISDALVTAITRELLRRLQSGEIKFTETKDAGQSSAGACPVSTCDTPKVISGISHTPGRKKVISETEIIRLCPVSAGPGQSIEIGPRDIITPLAEDYISKMRITVNRIG